MSIIATLTGLIPTLYGIVTAVEGLFGRGNGAAKKEAAVGLAQRKGISAENLGELIDLAVTLLNQTGWIGRPAIGGLLEPGKTYPVVFQPVALRDGLVVGNLRLDVSG